MKNRFPGARALDPAMHAQYRLSCAIVDALTRRHEDAWLVTCFTQAQQTQSYNRPAMSEASMVEASTLLLSPIKIR